MRGGLKLRTNLDQKTIKYIYTPEPGVLFLFWTVQNITRLVNPVKGCLRLLILEYYNLPDSGEKLVKW